MATVFSPTPGEAALVNQIFIKHDPQKFSVITGDVAVKVFGGANLNATTLGQIWGIADAENQGFLTRKGVSIAVRLLGWAQKGDPITADLVNKPGPLAVIDGFSSPSELRRAISPSPQSPASARLPPPLTAQDKAKFVRLFNGCGPVNGILSGEKAREVFVKSKLSVEKLSQIWNLSDTHNRGSLDVADFTVAMYLIQASMSGQLSFIPTTLPPGLYEMASDSSSSAAVSHTTGNSGSFSPGPSGTFPQNSGVRSQLTGKPIQPQYSGQHLQQQFTGPVLQHHTGPTNRNPPAPAPPPFATPSAAQTAQTAAAWDVTPVEKANADKLFDNLDSQKRGYIEGDVAVPFMIDSKLPENDLALIWDLADLNNDGHLTRDGFAVAMHIIMGRLAGKDIPSTLPPSLIPPSMRAAAVPSASPFHPPASESLKDLLWDDGPSSSPVTSQPQSSILQPQRTGPLNAQSSFSPPPVTAPQSSGRGAFGPGAFGPPASNKDLLSDDDDAGTGASSVAIHNHSIEIGNLQNQLQSTTRSLENTKTERSTIEATVQDQAVQLSTLQTQLSSAKAAYETETRLLSALRERFSNQTSQIQKAREELIHAESDLSAIRVEKTEVEQSLLRDKEEVRELQRRMTETGSMIEQVKVEIEKARKDAKQQKGLLAIAKKQLSARDAEKSKMSQELQEAVAEAEAITKELESAEAELAIEPTLATGSNGLPSISSPSPSGDSGAFITALPGSPGSPGTNGSVGAKSNNPFERRFPAGSGSRSQSPFLPFANPSTPTPADATSVASEGTTTDNLFTFDQVFGEGEEVRRAPDVDNIPTNPKENLSLFTPKIGGESQALNIAELSPPSSDQDLFSTPPTSALDALGAGAQSPPIEPDFLNLSSGGAPSSPPSTDQPPETHTDLNTSLKELDVNESESSDEDSEDETPLATLASRSPLASNKVTAGKEAPASNGHASPQTNFEASFPPITAAVAPSKTTDTQSNPFPAPTQNNNVFAAATSPFGVPSEPTGLTNFNEAFSGFPSAVPAAPEEKFSSDPGFDAEFDFGKESTSTSTPVVAVSPSGSAAFPPPPTSSSGISKSRTSPVGSGFENTFIPRQNTTSSARATSTVDGLPTLPQVVESKPFSFEDAFSSSLSPVAAPATSAAPGQPRPSSGVAELSFESAFGSNTTPGDSGFKSMASRTSTAPQVTESPTLSTFASSSPVHGPTSPRDAVARDTVGFPHSPSREASPPPRVASPKGRTSTSSSRESGDKVKEQGRYSKLSIRLPFGKRKKTQDTPPPSQLPKHLAPIADENVRRAPVDDDVEPLRRLLGMGFDRAQAVAALEAHSYDFQTALDSILTA